MKTHPIIHVLSILLTTASASWAAPDGANGLLLNFRDVPLRQVLSYLSEKAGLIVVSEADVQGTLTVTALQPVSMREAVSLLNDQLSRNNCTAMLDGRTLTIMEASRATTNALTPVFTATDPARIPVNNEIVTEILPMHILNPAQLAKDLQPLIPAGGMVTANEAGSALIMTARQKDVHRIAAIITALDSTAFSEVSVFALNYADAKSVAAELKELFQSADSDINRAGARVTFGRQFGRISGDVSGGEKTAPTRAVFVADEQMNAVAASAPPDYMPMIARVVGLLDRPGQEVTEMEVFPLLHADPVEIADEISSSFALAEGARNAEQPARPMGFQFGGAGMSPSISRAAAESDRIKRQTAVTAVADRRTQSVIVTAAGNTMAQIRKIIARLDNGTQGVEVLTVVSGGCADAGTLLQALTTLFPSAVSATHNQPLISTALDMRLQAQASGQSTPGATSGLPGGSGSAPGLR